METTLTPLLDILHELYIGTDGNPSWVIDHQPGYGLTKTVKTLTAKEASTPLFNGGSTIAAHTYHLKWSLDLALEFYSGRRPSAKWSDSWLVREVDDAQWEKLQQDLLNSYQKVKDAVAAVRDWSNPMLVKGTIALLPHAAYHLGAIKQLMLAVKQ